MSIEKRLARIEEDVRELKNPRKRRRAWQIKQARERAAAESDDIVVKLGSTTLYVETDAVTPMCTHIIGDLAVVITDEGDGEYACVIANAFPHVADLVGVGTIAVEFPGRATQIHPGVRLIAGGCDIFVSDTKARVGSDLPSVREFYTKYTNGDNSMFKTVNGLEIYGNTNADEGGGSLIYGNHKPWADAGPRGRFMCRALMMGYARRCPIFRWDREAFEVGQIISAGISRNDRTRAFAPVGYGSTEGENRKMPKVGEYRSLNGAHQGRIGHLAFESARQGSELAKLVLNAIAEDVTASWLNNGYDVSTDQVFGGKYPNFQWWGCYDILANYPSNIGCHFTGREFGHAMSIIGNRAIITGEQAHFKQVLVMSEVIQHCFSEKDGTPFLLPFTDPVFGRKVSAWDHKVRQEEFGDRVPGAAKPRAVKMFEVGILLQGMEALRRACDSSLHVCVMTAEYEAMWNFVDQHREQLHVFAPGHHEWSSERTVSWVNERLGLIKEDVLLNMHSILSPTSSGQAQCAPILY